MRRSDERQSISRWRACDWGVLHRPSRRGERDTQGHAVTHSNADSGSPQAREDLGHGSGRADGGALEEALQSLLRKEHERYLRTWENLTSNQRIGLRAIASGVENLFAYDSGLPIGPSSLHRVVEALHSRRILTDGARQEEIDDPYFREWILRYAMPDSVPGDL